MANVYVNLPLPALNGPGAAQDTSAMGKQKTITVTGSFPGAAITIEASVDAAGLVFAPLVTFQGGKQKRTFEVAARRMRVNVSGRSTLVAFSANIDVGSNDNGAQFADLTMPVFDGPGAAVDVSALGSFSTFVVSGTFPDAALLIEASEDGSDWAPLVQFGGKGGMRSKFVSQQFLRVNVKGRRAGAPFTNVSAAVGAANDAVSAAAGGTIDLQEAGVDVVGGPFTKLNFTADMTIVDAGGGIADLTPSAAAGGGDPTWYGTGVDGDLTVPAGTTIELSANFPELNAGRNYANVTIETGACLYLGGWPLRVSGTLLIEGTGTLEVSGMNGFGVAQGGNGGNTGGAGTTKSGKIVAAYTASALFFSGGGGGNAPAGAGGNTVSLSAIDQNTGGDGGAGSAGADPGGDGGVTTGTYRCYSTPYVAWGADDYDITSGATVEGGSGGGGGGAPAEGGVSGRGGGGGGCGRIAARVITCPDGAIKSTGGNGGPATGDDSGGGGGGMGGVLLIITDGPFDKDLKCDVTGGAGGAKTGTGLVGNAGDPGYVVALSPISGPL